jgi:anti-anti-sigma factor
MSESPLTSIEFLPRAVVVHLLAKNLGKAEVDRICDDVDAALAKAPGLPYVINMAAVAFAGSLAIGTLVGLNQEFQTRHQRLIFAGLQGPMERAIHITRINKVMEFLPDVPTALKIVEGEG